MATISNQLGPIQVYFFNSTGNALVRSEFQMIPLPAQFVPLRIGPDNKTYTYTKIVPTGLVPPQEFFVGQTVAALEAMTKNA